MMNDALVDVVPRVQSVTGVANLLDFRARTHGAKEAVVCGSERASFNQLCGRARAIANQLKQNGIKFGDRVATFQPNSIDFVATFFAILGIGAVVVPINPLLKPDEISHILQDSETVALVVHDSLARVAVQSLPNAKNLRLVVLAGTQEAGSLTGVPAGVRVEELAKGVGVDNGDWPISIQPEVDLGTLVYTSGTTGKPKGAMLTHHNLLSVFPGRLDLFEIDERDRCLATLPLCHIYGMTVVMIGTVSRGGTLVILPKFEQKAAEIIERERVTILPVVPAMYSMMLAEIDNRNGSTLSPSESATRETGTRRDETSVSESHPLDLSSVRLCFSGGSPLSPELLPKIEEAFGAPVIEGYALTETACVATINPMHGERKIASVGPAVPGVELAIFDDSFKQLPPGPENVGEIAVRGPNVMIGYYKQPAATAEVIKDGWFLTGDLGYRDADNYIFIVGRKKELILRGGANIYPREVEDVIMKLPGVREVAVIGVPDERMGERVKAIVVRSDATLTEDAIKQHCAERLADYKVPRIVEFSEGLPRNSTGKVLKRLLS
jgi:long-chain acyl-CoA synthetase